AYAAYAAGSAEAANEADGPLSAPWTPVRIRLWREYVCPAPRPVELAHARPHPLAPLLERCKNRSLVGPAHATALDHQAAVDPDAIDVLGGRVVDDVLHWIAQWRHAPRGALP